MLTKFLSDLERASPSVMVLTNREDLKKAVGSMSPMVFVLAVKLRIPLLSPPELSKWQSRIDKHLEVCGCGEGRIGIFVALGLFGAYRGIDPFQQSWNGWRTFLTGLALVVVGAVVGKVMGLVKARRELRGTLGELEIALSRTEDLLPGKAAPG